MSPQGARDLLVAATSQTLSVERGGRRRLRLPRSVTVAKYAMVMPALSLFLVFYVTPVIAGVVISLFRWNGLESPSYIGFGNYERLFEDPVFVDNVRVTLVVVGVSLAVI